MICEDDGQAIWYVNNFTKGTQQLKQFQDP